MSLISHAIEDFSHFLYQEENNSSLLPHMDFSFLTLLRLISDATLGLQEHARMFVYLRLFGSSQCLANIGARDQRAKHWQEKHMQGSKRY